MRRINSILSIILCLLLCFLFASCIIEDTTPKKPVYIETQTDITVSSGVLDSYIERDDYSFTVTKLTVDIEGKKEFTSLINTELNEWLKYGMETCDALISKESNSERVYRVVNSVTYNAKGLLSLKCSIDYSEYGETFSKALKSAVWDVGREEKISPLMMFKMSDVDFENFLTMNVAPPVSAYPNSYPKYLSDSVGMYSRYMDYYILDESVYFYLLNKDIKYSIEDVSFKAAFEDLSELFKYDISPE